MSYELLDDAIYENLESEEIQKYSAKTRNRVLILSLFFGIFAGFCVLVTLEALNKSDVFFLAAALFTQIGTIFLCIRLFLYQYHIQKKQDWNAVFEAKYKAWRALATVFGLTLSSVILLVINANGGF